jgi:hypothetical protein
LDKPEFKSIPVEQLEKLVNKIKNSVVHHIAVLYDLIHKNDPKPRDEDDIEIIEVEEKKEIEEGKDGEFYRTDSMMSENLVAKKEESQNNSISSLKRSETRVDPLRRDLKPAIANRNFYLQKYF